MHSKAMVIIVYIITTRLQIMIFRVCIETDAVLYAVGWNTNWFNISEGLFDNSKQDLLYLHFLLEN